MSAKFLTSVIAAGAMIATMSIATPADALNKRERAIVGGIALGVIGTLAIQNHNKNKRARTTYRQPTYSTCHNPYRTYRNGRLVTVCR